MNSGIVFNIQKYSIHDGPGIRTTVFLKGCPLNCSWCHNPESQAVKPQLVFYGSRCIGCGKCLAVCRTGAISVKDGVMTNSSDKCVQCGRCTEVCYAAAREMAGRSMTVDEVLSEAAKDAVFYEESGGGVTFSGGEPLQQPDFLGELLEDCSSRGIHTAVDTCGYTSRELLAKIAARTDLFLYDLKLIDDGKHKLYTGVSNSIILENLKMLAGLGKRIFARIPIIPGVNDGEEDIRDFCSVICSIRGIERTHILPYHNIAAEKYRRLNMDYSLADTKEPTTERMQELAGLFRYNGVDVIIGG